MLNNKVCLKNLSDQIDDLRNYMIEMINANGLNHPESIKVSQELDVLLSHYQKAISNS
ncbi:aspartyl-phosphate phosphatase Spo0E family protein [Niallia endozanthoxylica]|nr:aspartyl-phosphate phosphatase Spo0E family protein [Niallia endozanthoxylica]